MIIAEMDTSFEKGAEYEAIIQQASTAYLQHQYKTSASKYNDALVLSSDLKMSKMTKTILKYMICLCLIESNNLQDLAEVVMMLKTIEKSLKDRLPDIYYLLARAHCKLYRFDQAVEAINGGIAVFKSQKLLETFYIPGTNVSINLVDKEIWSKIKEECQSWHKPDAVCSLENCCNITPPYVTANKNIFLKDPAFNGMVVVHCNNKKRVCSLKFHQCCWKYKKDQLYPYAKTSDKDVIGNHCFTPNCLNDNIPCIVSAIEIVGSNGEVKAHMKESISLPWAAHNKNTSKGAIKKTKLTTPRKMENPSEAIKYPVNGSQEIITDKQICNSYEDDQILAVRDILTDFDFSYDPPHIAAEKNFLFSFFHHYIQNNLVRVSDVYTKFTEIKEDLNLKNLDIMEFLLHTNKIEVLSKKPAGHSLTPKDQENFRVKTEPIEQVNLNKTIDIDDMYNDLMGDDYEFYETAEDSQAENKNSISKSQDVTTNQSILHENYTLGSNACKTNYDYDQAGGDSSLNTKYVASNSTLYDFPSKSHYNEPQKKTSENRKLKEYIEKLESEMGELLDKENKLKSELKQKDLKIYAMTKEQEEYTKEVHNVCEKLKDFQIRHDEIRAENLRIKTEMINVLRDKKLLEEKFSEMDNRDSKKQDLVKMFQEEYKILEEHINEDWKEKINELEKALAEQIKLKCELKTSLLNKCINYQYSSNKNVLKGYLDQCATALEIINKINLWMESTLSIKNFVDSTEWIGRFSYLNNIVSNYQRCYSETLEKVNSQETEPDEINLNLPDIQNPPSVNLSELVLNALNTFYKGQCHVMQSAMKLQQQSMAYQVPRMPVNNVPYNQFSQHYPYGPTYLPPRQTMIPNSLMPPGMMNFQMQRMTMPPPMMPQNYAQHIHHVPKIIDLPSNSNDELVDSSSTNVDVDNSSDIALKTNNPSNKEQMIQSSREMMEDNEEENKEDDIVQIKEETISEKEMETNYDADGIDQKKDETMFGKEEIKQSVNQKSIQNEKMAKMRKVCKAIALQIQQKTSLDNYEAERYDLASNEYLSKVNNVEEEYSNIDNNENVESRSLELVCTNSVNNSTVNSSEENTVTPKKKVGIDALIKMMKQKYPEALEIEIIEAISDIRRRHNNTLSRMPVSQILQESDDFMKQKHSLHTLRYIKVEGNKSTPNETSTRSSGSNPNETKTVISPATSFTSLNKVSESPAQKKKTWNKITPCDNIQWSSSGEIECSICMNIVNNNANSYTLNCRHTFHKQCVKSWLKSDRSCPNCRVAVTEDDEFPPLPA